MDSNIVEEILRLKREMESQIMTRSRRKRYREEINKLYDNIYMDNFSPSNKKLKINDLEDDFIEEDVFNDESGFEFPLENIVETSNEGSNINLDESLTITSSKSNLEVMKDDIKTSLKNDMKIDSSNTSINIDVNTFAEFLSSKVIENVFKKIQIIDDGYDEDFIDIGSYSGVGGMKKDKLSVDEEESKYKKMLETFNRGNRDYFNKLSESEKDKIYSMYEELIDYNKNDMPIKIRSLKLPLDMYSKTTIYDKIDKIENIDPSDSEYFKIKKWIDACMKIPFGVYKPLPVKKKDPISKIKKFMNNIQKNLNKCIYGQDHAKNKIIQIIGQWISNPNSKGQIIGLCGPPGVGKTSIIKEGLSKCLDIPFGFIALGGAHDESLLVGHSETYVGSTWGRIVDILMKSKCMNPIIMLDELDKISSRRGESDEISGVLTHLTDPSQNKEFQDNYFGNINLDLSKALFIFSYNDISRLNPILRDRITNVQFNSFTPLEKITIAQKYLFPRILKDVGFKKNDVKIADLDILYIIESYTYESGVRRLNERLYEIVRTFNIEYLKKKNGKLPFTITRDYINRVFYKTNRIKNAKVADEAMVGLVNGLYADGISGGITVIETKKMFNSEKMGVVMTGSLGRVMKESVRCAKTVVWNLLEEKDKVKIEKELKKRPFGFHINCHEAAVEKEGPSAGVTITTALYSLLTGRKVRNDIAMTGEIDLNGNVHDIGGLEHKLYGAKQAGVKLAFIPKGNEETFLRIKEKYEELGEECIEVRPVKHISEILAEALI